MFECWQDLLCQGTPVGCKATQPVPPSGETVAQMLFSDWGINHHLWSMAVSGSPDVGGRSIDEVYGFFKDTLRGHDLIDDMKLWGGDQTVRQLAEIGTSAPRVSGKLLPNDLAKLANGHPVIVQIHIPGTTDLNH